MVSVDSPLGARLLVDRLEPGADAPGAARFVRARPEAEGEAAAARRDRLPGCGRSPTYRPVAAWHHLPSGRGPSCSKSGLRRPEAGANVLLVEPFDSVVFDPTWDRNSITYATLTQVAADLLTSPGRGPAEAEELIRWAEQDEHVWRA